jgi:hypothetical protein
MAFIPAIADFELNKNGNKENEHSVKFYAELLSDSHWKQLEIKFMKDYSKL